MTKQNELINKNWGTTAKIYQKPCKSFHLLNFLSNQCCSLHYHENKSNSFILLDGKVSVWRCLDSIDKLINDPSGCRWVNDDLVAGIPFVVDKLIPHLFVCMSDGIMVEQYDSIDIDCADEDIVRLVDGVDICSYNVITDIVRIIMLRRSYAV